MSVSELEILKLYAGNKRSPLRVGLLEGEPAGVIPTRHAGRAEFEATLEWPPGWEGPTSVASRLPDLLALESGGVRGSLEESCGRELTTVRGSLSCIEEEALCSVLDETLRAVASVATVREAALRTRVARPSRIWSPAPGAVEILAGWLWRSGMRVRFGVSWSPATSDADIMVGCGGVREELVRALSAGVSSGVERVGAAG